MFKYVILVLILKKLFTLTLYLYIYVISINHNEIQLTFNNVLLLIPKESFQCSCFHSKMSRLQEKYLQSSGITFVSGIEYPSICQQVLQYQKHKNLTFSLSSLNMYCETLDTIHCVSKQRCMSMATLFNHLIII